MASINEHLKKLREERIAREKARIDKLRELNLKKYSNIESGPSFKSASVVNTKQERKSSIFNVSKVPKNNFHVNGTTKRPISAPAADKNLVLPSSNTKPAVPNVAKVNSNNNAKKETKIEDRTKKIAPNVAKADNSKNASASINKAAVATNSIALKKSNATKANGTGFDSKLPRKSVINFAPAKNVETKILASRKSFQPQCVAQNTVKPNPNRQSVFERLYQPKVAAKKDIPDSEKMQTDPKFFQKIIKNTGLIVNRRMTTHEPKERAKIAVPVRRSISAVHLKRINKAELSGCFHKWSSISEKLDKVHLKDISEDSNVKGDKIVSAVKSERKKVKFQTPVPSLNTPRPEELQARLQNWLLKRGKSLDSYHHLQCFGINHLTHKQLQPLNLDNLEKYEEFNDENKENEPLESDSDNESFEDNMNNKVDNNKWRRASNVSSVADFNESNDTTLTSESHHVDDLLIGALNDLTQLLREGFEWEQSARWLRAIRERFPLATRSAAYWECRAALEERRGDLPASLQCWEEAIAQGTERSVVEANLDQLLDKFMQLKISPNSGKKKKPDPKMVDVKNVFKSTLIRFAVQQAKLRQSQELPKFTLTPVRRSGRLSSHFKRTPLQLCSSVHEAGRLGLGHNLVFVPNKQLCNTP